MDIARAIVGEKDSELDYAAIYNRNFSMVWHICLAYMKNQNEAEDALQETFLRMVKCRQSFQTEEHEKAWLIVTAQNVCKNMLKHWWRKRVTVDDEEKAGISKPYEIDTTLQAVMELPNKYKIPIYLYYYMEYDSVEIASILHKPKSTIRNYLSEARKLLRQTIEL